MCQPVDCALACGEGERLGQVYSRVKDLIDYAEMQLPAIECDSLGPQRSSSSSLRQLTHPLTPGWDLWSTLLPGFKHTIDIYVQMYICTGSILKTSCEMKPLRG